MSIRGADLAPFPALRYDAARVGGLEQVITQPYDKISPAMLERYHRRSSYNLARVVKNANYAEAAANLDAWKREGVDVFVINHVNVERE